MIIKKPTLFASRLNVQIGHYIKYRPRFSLRDDSQDREDLECLAREIRKKDVAEITTDDLEMFESYLRRNFSTYNVECKLILVRSFLRYYNQQKIIVKKRPGRPAKIEEIVRVKKLVDEGYSFRDVSEKTGMNISLVHRRYYYPIKELEKSLD